MRIQWLALAALAAGLSPAYAAASGPASCGHTGVEVSYLERAERRRAQLPQKTGEPWSEDEDRKLLSAFDAGRGLQELAAAHERTTSAIRGRLVKYGRLAS